MTPEQEKRLREMSLDEMSKYTIQKMESAAQFEYLNKHEMKSHWSSLGGKIQGHKNAESGHMKEIQKLSPKKWTKEASSNGGKATMSGDKAKEIQSMGGKVGGKLSQQIERECPHCNKSVKGPLYFRYHGDKCKNKN